MVNVTETSTHDRLIKVSILQQKQHVTVHITVQYDIHNNLYNMQLSFEKAKPLTSYKSPLLPDKFSMLLKLLQEVQSKQNPCF